MPDKTSTLANVRLLDGQLVTISIADGVFTAVRDQAGVMLNLPRSIPIEEAEEGFLQEDFDAHGQLFVPGAIDAHIHSRDPGFPEKESWESVARSAYAGGVVGVIDMPNTLPATIDLNTLADKTDRAQRAGIDARFLLGVGADTIGRLGKTLRDAADLPLAGLKVFYGQTTGNLVFSDLNALHRQIPEDFPGIIVFHAEDQCGIDANVAQLERVHGSSPIPYAVHSELRSPEVAVKATLTILDWAVKTKRRVHIAHVSTAEEAQAVLGAQRDGARVSSEVAPHHLLFSTADYTRLGGRLKVNPPVRSPEIVAQMREMFAAGAFDCFATDHAPHTREEKLLPYEQCPSGLPALELFWPLLAQCHALTNKRLSPAQLLACAAERPARLFGFARRGKIAPGYSADLVWLQEQPFDVSRWNVVSRCGWTPYNDMVLPIHVRGTWADGRLRQANW